MNGQGGREPSEERHDERETPALVGRLGVAQRGRWILASNKVRSAHEASERWRAAPSNARENHSTELRR